MAQITTLSLPIAYEGWTDSGVVVKAGDFLEITASGVGGTSTGSNGKYWVSYPEGTYITLPESNFSALQYPPHDEDRGGAKTTAQQNYTGLPVCSNVRIFSLAMLILPEGQTPAFGQNAVNNAIQVNRSYSVDSLEAGGRIWFLYNDIPNFYYDNYGTFDIKIRYNGDVDAGLITPLRYCPPHIMAQKMGPSGVLCWALYIQFRDGTWRGFTDWNIPFTTPFNSDAKGNSIPRTVCNPAGASLSNQQFELKLGSRATDAKFLSPRYDSFAQMGAPGALYIDREMLEAGEFEGAFWALGEVDPEYPDGGVMWWNCGHIGNVEYGGLEGSAELLSFDEIVNRDTSSKLHVFCQVGTRPNEDFGLLRCFNEVLQNGPRRVDWSTYATVLAGSTLTELNLSYDKAYTVVGTSLPDIFEQRLANGDLEFPTANLGGGRNAGHKIKIRDGVVLSSNGTQRTIRVSTKLSLQFLPQVGDKVVLVGGCKKTKDACRQVNNLGNGRFQELPDNEDVINQTRI